MSDTHTDGRIAVIERERDEARDEAERLREALTTIARRGDGAQHARENWLTARDAIRSEGEDAR